MGMYDVIFGTMRIVIIKHTTRDETNKVPVRNTTKNKVSFCFIPLLGEIIVTESLYSVSNLTVLTNLMGTTC
ncbi:CLUMA_CG000400, isoform A [Clunio marinus]|uniref:CLUMA_CG000400, isoform A n=1 Tax=Clunio marinus TaxID=568069 RepID=A0A1J1HF68_9DIPT|nr:CLUMA_CG000400, isoform A [Clunio marinus]